MADNPYIALPSVQDDLEAIEEGVKGQLATVIDVDNHMVRVSIYGKRDMQWYLCSARYVDVGTVGLLIPARGGNGMFIPSSSTMPTAGRRPFSTVWAPSRWMGSRAILGSLGVQGAVGGSLSFPVTANTVYTTPFVPPHDVVVDAIATYVQTPVAGSQVIMGIYDSRHSLQWPEGLVTKATMTSAASGTASVLLPSPVSLKENHIYYLAVMGSSSSLALLSFYPVMHWSQYTGINTHNYSGFSRNFASFDMPDESITSSFIQNYLPVVELRRQA